MGLLRDLLDQHLKDPKWNTAGTAGLAFCQAHPDGATHGRRSLSFTIEPMETGGEKAKLHCFAGCSQAAVVEAAGLEMRQLFSDNLVEDVHRDDREAAKAQEQPAPHVEPKIVAVYNYVDAKGALAYQVVRLEPKAFRQRRPDGRGGFVWDLGGVEPLLYRLDTLKVGMELLILCEGEKDRDNVAALNLFATTNSGGGANWKPTHTAQVLALKPRRVAIMEHNDDTGKRFTSKIAPELMAAGIEVKVVTAAELGGLPAKGDISDWLAVPGHDAETLLAIIEAAPLYAGPEAEVQDLEELGAEATLIQTIPLPDAVRKGLAHDFAMLYDGKSDAPYPFLYFSFLSRAAASFSPFARILGGMSEMLIVLYVVLLGASAAGRKSTARDAAKVLWGMLPSPWDTHLYLPDGLPASNVGLVKAAVAAGVRPVLIDWDEFTGLLHKMGIQNATMAEVINTAFDSTEMGTKTKDMDQYTNTAYLNLLAGTTDESWIREFTSQTVRVGFLNRLWLVPAYRTHYLETARAVDLKTAREIGEHLAARLAEAAHKGRIVFPGITGAADEVFCTWARRHTELQQDQSAQRVDVYVQRLAATLTLLEGVGARRELSATAMEVACALGSWQIGARRLAYPLQGDNDDAIREGELRRFLLGQFAVPFVAEHGVPKRTAQQHFSRWGSYKFKQALDGLIGNREVKVEDTDSMGPRQRKVIKQTPEGIFRERVQSRPIVVSAPGARPEAKPKPRGESL